MLTIAAHFHPYSDAVLSVAWAVAAILSISGFFHAESRILRPFRIYGTTLSLAWMFWYFGEFTHWIDKLPFHSLDFHDNLADGLMIATVSYVIIVILTAHRLFPQYDASKNRAEE